MCRKRKEPKKAKSHGQKKLVSDVDSVVMIAMYMNSSNGTNQALFLETTGKPRGPWSCAWGSMTQSVFFCFPWKWKWKCEFDEERKTKYWDHRINTQA